MSRGWKKLPKGLIVDWCKDRGVIRLSNLGKRPRYLVPRDERKELIRLGPNWRALHAAANIHWCRGCGCVKFDGGKGTRYLVPQREREQRIFIKNLHERCQ